MTTESASLMADNPFYVTGEIDDIFINIETLEREAIAHPRTPQRQPADSLVRKAISAQLMKARNQMIIAQARFHITELNNEILDLEDQRMIGKVEQQIETVRLQQSNPQVVDVFGRIRDEGSQSSLSNQVLEAAESELLDSPTWISREGISESELTSLQEALTDVQSQVQKLNRELEKTEYRLSHAQQTEALQRRTAEFEQALKAGRMRSSQMDEKLANVEAEVKGLNQQIEEERNMHTELRAMIERTRKEIVPQIHQFQSGHAECSALLKGRLCEIRIAELLLAYYRRRIVKQKGDLQLIPKYRKDVSGLRQAVDRLKNQVAPGPALACAEYKVHGEMDADEMSMLRSLDGRDRALLTRIRGLLTQLTKLKLPIPPQPEALPTEDVITFPLS
jgi:chromosome segregation ATPase